MQRAKVSLQPQKQLSKNKNAISLYTDDLTEEGIVEACANLVVIYPDLNDSFLKIFGRLAKKQGFTNQRLIDSVENTILNCPYKKPSISEILNFDRTLSIFTYNDILLKIDDGDSFENYKRIKMHSRTVYVTIKDFHKYKLTALKPGEK